MNRILAAATLLAGVALAGTVHADAVSDFYKGKQVKLIIGYPAGSGYDVHARLLGRHMARYIPGEPSIIPQNMLGAGSIRAANYIYNVAPKDGLSIGAINRSVPLAPLLGTTEKEQTQFDPLKFGWVGSMNSTVSIAIVWADSGIKTFDELMKREVIVAASAPASDSFVFANILKNIVGAKLKIVSGYQGSTENYLALERGEATGYMGTSYSSLKATRPDWIRDHKVNILVQISLAKDPALPDVPLVMDYANDKQKHALELILAPQQAGRPYMTTPGVDPARLAALQKAFMETMQDPQFVAEAQKEQIDIDPMDGPAVLALLERLYKSTPDVVKAAQDALKVTP
ncbi:MAG TPA: tripartite tricarboxylate transporter substrate-binding protein [Alphaproteobacteria bacterium]|jgi:tripartite-type tricarboxylate transporter receptor subunit TctC|nr:tripartite tricarboxylate transporter substrate-binding protein [Alphaproteobacteria bacterium]